ncbi:MAG: hypothetical protein R3E10_03810 [Gemmatimonadota bacterium]
MTRLRLAAFFIALYGLILVANAAFFWSWSGEAGDLLRLGARLFGCGLACHGLWTGATWGWWLAAIFSGVLGVLGMLSIIPLLAADVFANRPYPMLDIAAYIGFTTALGAAFVLLMTPAARRAASDRQSVGE